MENDLEQKNNKNNNQTNTVPLNSSYDTNKQLLIKLLKEKLDTRLCRLEKRNKNHIAMMKMTTEDIKNITDWSFNANKQIKEKLKKDKDKEKQIPQPKPNKIKKKETTPIGKTSYLKTKTPLRSNNPKTFTLEDTKTDTNRNIKNKTFYSSKTMKSLGTRTKSLSYLTKDKDKDKKKKNDIKSNYNKTQNNNMNSIGNNFLKRPSLISTKSSKSNKTTIITSKTPKRKRTVKISNKNITPVRKKTPFTKRNNKGSEKAESVHSAHSTHTYNNKNKNKDILNKKEIIKKSEDNKTIDEMNMNINMNKMESALQKDDLLNDNDPLLVAPITDSDFYPNGKISANNTINSEVGDHDKIEKTHSSIIYFSMEKNINDKLFSKISDYLNINDLIQFKSVSKYFYKLFKVYIITKLLKDKAFFMEKKNSFNKDEITPEINFNDFAISKGSLKAIKLLNEPSLNHIFTEESPPNNDRLIIYRIFFQLIKHPYRFIPNDQKKEFWEKCQKYFLNENKSKAGELLQKALDEKLINVEGDNLYKIYKLTENNLDIIYPSYFSKICGTTGLVVFFIKDILDFVGISNDKKIQNKAYWSYEKIIESLENKINQIKKLGHK